jgi:hypothetical protein
MESTPITNGYIISDICYFIQSQQPRTRTQESGGRLLASPGGQDDVGQKQIEWGS